VLDNAGTFELGDESAISEGNWTTTAPKFVNSGTLTVDAPNTSTIEVPFDNSGTVQLTAGTLDVYSSNVTGDHDSGAYKEPSGTTMAFNGTRTLGRRPPSAAPARWSWTAARSRSTPRSAWPT